MFIPSTVPVISVRHFTPVVANGCHLTPVERVWSAVHKFEVKLIIGIKTMFLSKQVRIIYNQKMRSIVETLGFQINFRVGGEVSTGSGCPSI